MYQLFFYWRTSDLDRFSVFQLFPWCKLELQNIGFLWFRWTSLPCQHNSIFHLYPNAGGIHASPPGMMRPHLFHSILVAQCFWPRLAFWWPIHGSFWYFWFNNYIFWMVDLGWVPEAVAWSKPIRNQQFWHDATFFMRPAAWMQLRCSRPVKSQNL